MKMLLVAFLALSLSAGGAAAPSTPLDSAQLQSLTGTGFWGGLACGTAVAGTAVGTVALIGFIGAGTTIGLGAAFAYSVALEGAALCALIA
jgi:hypothetical protein